MFNCPRIIISDEKKLENKKEIFGKSYNKNEDKILVVTDFDYSDQKEFQDKRKMLHSIYLKYEEDTSIDENIRKEKIKD